MADIRSECLQEVGILIRMDIFTQRAWKRFWQSTPGRVGFVLAIALLLLALLAPVLNPYDPATDRDYLARLVAPSPEHWFGTDALGRDIFTLVWYGIRTSLLISLVSVSLGSVIGLTLGLVAGYARGQVESVINWLTDILLAFPSILLAIAIVTVAGPSIQGAMIAISIVQVPIYIRLMRAMVLSLREQEFVQAARALGATPVHILWQHILPAGLAPVIVQASLSIGTATLEAAGLGFLGLGAQPPTPELGTMLADAFKGGYSLTSPWTTIFPGLFITLIVLSFNLLGDGLRDSFDPRSG
ncbi:ABC-type dipeptide/oligopeptide/nickel transport system, permease component [Leptolyngbyaceae cyanobacterium JSC-12]|nr:ABC-type dipeptide/oligopeptide/nickel transport system, permease component [Leptolyngbyaceae cyanobacterium JSC-12]